METLFAKIDAEPARSGTSSINLGARLAGWLAGPTPRTLAWAGSSAALAILLQA